jgi:hypothetical protein
MYTGCVISPSRGALRATGFAGMAGFLLLTVASHILQADYSPWTTTLSEYALGSNGFLSIAAFLALGMGSVAWYLLLVRQGMLRRWRLGMICLLVWTLGIFCAQIFLTDPGGIPTSVQGVVHGVAASLAIGSLFVAEVSALTWIKRFRQGIVKVIAIFVCLAIPLSILLAAGRFFQFAMVERVVVAAHLLWLGVVIGYGFQDLSPQEA